MAKKPKYFTISDEKAASLRKHRVLGGANTKGTAANASVRSASQSSASKANNVGAARSSGPGGGSLNAPSRTAPSSGRGGSDVGSQKSSDRGVTKSPMSGQGASYKSPEAARDATAKAINRSFMDNMRSQNAERMATERAKSFGPRVGVDKTAGAIPASRIAAQSALDRIASGSSVVGVTPSKLQDRVLAEPTRKTVSQPEVKLRQDPTIPTNLGNLAGQYSQYRSPPAPTTEAYTSATGRYAAAQDPTGIPMPSGRAFPLSQQISPTPVSEAQRLASQYSQYRSPPGVAAYDVVQDPRANVNDYRLNMGVSDNTFVSPKGPSVAAASIGQPENLENIVGVSGYATPNLDRQTLEYAFNNPEGSWSALNNIGRIKSTPAAVAKFYQEAPVMGDTPSYFPNGVAYGAKPNAETSVSVPQYGFTNPYAGGVVNSAVNQVYPANTQPTQTDQVVAEAVTDADTYSPNYSPSVAKAVEPIAAWAANKLGTRVAPSQQDSWMGRVDQALKDRFGTPGPDSAYARMMQNAADRSSSDRQVSPQQPPAPAPVAPPATPAPPAPALPPLPPYVNYQQLPPDYSSYGYSGGVAPSPLVAQYAGGAFADGGSVLAKSGFPPEVMARSLNIALSMNPNRTDAGRRLDRKMIEGMYQAFGGQGSYFDRQNAPAASAPAPAPSQPTPQAQPAQQYTAPTFQSAELPLPTQAISDFNRDGGLLQQQNQMFRLPQKRGGGVGDRIDAAIMLAKSFS